MFRLPLISLMVLALCAGNSLAADKPVLSKNEAKIEQRTEQLLSKMNDAQKTEFATIKMGHGVVQAVEHTNKTIDRAIKSCKKNNPDMKSDLSGAYKNWTKNLSPVLRKSRARVDHMIKKQTFAKPLVVRSYLKEYDDVVKKRNEKIVEAPITSADDCKKLTEKMHDVNGELIELLTDTLKLNSEF